MIVAEDMGVGIGQQLRSLLVLSAAVSLGLGLLPVFSVGGVSISAVLCLLAMALYPVFPSRAIVDRPLPVAYLPVPPFIVSCLLGQTNDSLMIAVRVLAGWLVAFTVFFELSRRARLRAFLYCIVLGGVLLLLVLEYYSIFVYHSPFLSADISEPTRAGRNSIGFFLAAAIPATLVLPTAVLRGVVLAFFLVSAVYLQSRGALFASAVGFGAVLLARGWRALRAGFRPPLPHRQSALPAAVVVLLLLLLALGYGTVQEQLERYVLVEHTSDDLRLRLAAIAVDAFRSHTLTGIGAGRFQYISPEGLLTHNDYLSVLAEQGLVGFLPFLGIVLAVILRAKDLAGGKVVGGKWLLPSWRSSDTARAYMGFTLATYLLVINAYTALVFWVVLGTVFATPRTEAPEHSKRSLS